MQADGQLVIDSVRIDPAEIVEAGTYDLEGLFLRLGLAVEQVGAKRVVLDTIEVLFSALPNEAIVRGELSPAVPVAEGPRADHRRHRGTRPRAS